MRTFRHITLVLLILLSGCYEFPDVPTDEAPNGDIDNVMIIGGSWLSGIKDGVFDNASVESAIGGLFLGQFDPSEEQGFGFQISEGMGSNLYNTTNGNGRSFLNYTSLDHPTPEITYESGGQPLTYQNPNSASATNLAHPGYRFFHLDQPGVLSTSNQPGGFSIRDRIQSQVPDMVLIELGIEEFLGYLFAGGEGDANVTDLSMLTVNDIPAAQLYENYLRTLINEILGVNPQARIVLFNTPDVSKFAYFHQLSDFTVTNYFADDDEFNEWASLSYTNPNSFNSIIFDAYRNLMLPLGGAFIWPDESDTGQPWQRWTWRWVVDDVTVPLVQNYDFTYLNDQSMLVTETVDIPQIREVERNEKVLFEVEKLVFNDRLGYINNAIPEELFIDSGELAAFESTLAAYNSVLTTLTSEFSSVNIFDLKGVIDLFYEGEDRSFREIVPADGIEINNVPMFPKFTVNGFFSSDGINPNARGSAYLANEMIRFFNANYGLEMEALEPNKFVGNVIIQSF